MSRAISMLAVTLLLGAQPDDSHAELLLYESNEGRRQLSASADVYAAFFAGSESWFGASASFLGADVDRWMELGAEPALSFRAPVGGGTLVAGLSGAFTATSGDDASGLTVGLNDTSSATLEQAYVEWRASGLFPALEDDVFSVSAGRRDYGVGTNLVIGDGGGDGAERGGWYLGLRRAFSHSMVVELDTKRWLLSAFRLENEPREGGAHGSGTGANVERRFGDGLSMGLSYLVVDVADGATDDLDVWSARFDWHHTSGFRLAGEYVDQRGRGVGSSGYYGEVRYQFGNRTTWQAELTWRHARFGGDDPATGVDERYREVAYGYYDYGYWYQGEITGGYALGNSNLASHMLRLRAKPTESLTVNGFFYDFALDQPASLASGVTSDDWGREMDLTADWALSESVSVTAILGVLSPGSAAEQWTSGDDDWIHGMILVAYSW